jgi:hypothetical protein
MSVLRLLQNIFAEKIGKQLCKCDSKYYVVYIIQRISALVFEKIDDIFLAKIDRYRRNDHYFRYFRTFSAKFFILKTNVMINFFRKMQ